MSRSQLKYFFHNSRSTNQTIQSKTINTHCFLLEDVQTTDFCHLEVKGEVADGANGAAHPGGICSLSLIQQDDIIMSSVQECLYGCPETSGLFTPPIRPSGYDNVWPVVQ